MDNKEFDKNIKELLESMKTNAPVNDWDAFSELLTQEQGFEDIAFDKEVSEKLLDKKKSFNSLHWVLLKNRLEKEAKIRNEVLRLKIIESSFVLLLLFTFFNVGPHFSKKNTTLPIASNIIISSSSSTSDIQKKYTEDGSSQIINLSEIKSNELPSNSSIQINKNQIYKSIESKNKDLNLPYNNHSKQNSSISIPLVEGGSKPMVFSPPKKENQDIYIPQDDVPALKTIASLELEPISSNSISVNATPEIDLGVLLPKKKKNKVYLTTDLMTMASLIQTPKDDLLNLSEYSSVDLNYGAGVGISSQMGRSEFGTGLNYQKIKYRPVRVTELNGGGSEPISKTSFDGIKYDIIEVPVQFKYHFKPSSEDKTHLWAGAGLSYNLVAFADYEINNEIVSVGFSPTNPIRESGSRNYFESKDFPEGLFEKGSLFDNFFVMANASVGLESRINDHLAFNTSLSYLKSLTQQGLGPNEDSLDAIKLSAGLKFRL